MSGMPWEDFKPSTSSSGPWDDFKSQEDHSIGNNLSVIGAAANAASNLAPWNRLTQARQKLGGDIAEAGGYVGGKVANAGFPDTGNAIQATGIGLGAIPAIGPEVLAAYTSLQGLYNPQNPVASGIVNTPKDLSPQYAAQNQAIGISNNVPETASRAVNPDPYQYPSQLTKPKYVNVKPTDLPVMPGGQTGKPYALFDYNDPITGQSNYQIHGDPSLTGIKTTGNAPLSALQEKGIPVVGQTQKAATLGQPPIDNANAPTIQPVSNPGGASFTRQKPQIPAEQLPSTVPLKYPEDSGTLINQINHRVDLHGTNLSPQELSDYHQLLSTRMADGTIPQFGQGGVKNPLYAQAAQASKKVTTTLNQVAEPLLANAQQSGALPQNIIQTRAGLNQAYRTAQLPAQIRQGLLKTGKYGAEAGAGMATIYGIYQGLKRLSQ